MDLTPTEIDERNALRDRKVLDAAARIVETQGLSGLTRDAIADCAQVSPASVSNFGRHRISNGTHDDTGYRARILRAMMDEAIEAGDVTMLRVGLADGCLKPADIPDELRVQAIM